MTNYTVSCASCHYLSNIAFRALKHDMISYDAVVYHHHTVKGNKTVFIFQMLPYSSDQTDCSAEKSSIVCMKESERERVKNLRMMVFSFLCFYHRHTSHQAQKHVRVTNKSE